MTAETDANKPTIILSMPNCASDWFAYCIEKSLDKCKYFREFFNPITNIKYADLLMEEFGCESISAYQKICHFDQEKCEDIFQKSWKKCDYNITKENFSAFKIPFYAKNFNCVCLVRDIRNSLPSTRNEVYGWYDAIYQSMSNNLMNIDNVLYQKFFDLNKKCKKFIEKVVLSFLIYQEKLINSCNLLKIPIVNTECLMFKQQILKCLHFLDKNIRDKIYKNIMLSKKDMFDRNFTSLECNWLLPHFEDLSYKPRLYL